MSALRTAPYRRCGVDVMDAIYQRRAVRAYTARMVDANLVNELVDAAIHAPSAMNHQPWAFVVVQDKAFLHRISERSKELMRARLAPEGPHSDHLAMLADPAFNVFYDASTLIVVCAAPAEWPANEDCCLAAQNILLAAHGLGLASCPIGFARAALDEPASKRVLAIPADHEVVMPIVVGYPREVPRPTERREPRILCWRQP